MTGQEIADKDYYLIDSLDLTELSEDDRELLEVSLKEYHASEEAYEKVEVLAYICDNLMHQDWSKYQYFQFHFIREALRDQPTADVERTLLSSLASAVGNIGFIFQDEGDLPNALACFQQSESYHQAIGDLQAVAISSNNIGHVYYEKGDIPNALECWNKSLILEEKLGNLEGIAIVLNNIGTLYSDQGDDSTALDYYSKCFRVEEIIGDQIGLAGSLNNAGAIYATQGKCAIALDHFERSLIISQEMSNKEGIADCYEYMGSVYHQQDESKKALEYYYLSLNLYKEVEDVRGITSLLNAIASIKFANGNIDAPDGAIALGEESLELAEYIGLPIYIMKSASLLSAIYTDQGDGLEALEMYQLEIQMRDSINNRTTQAATAHQLAKYEYDKKKAIDDVENDKQIGIEKEGKEKQKILTIMALAGAALVAGFLIFVFNRLRITKKQKLIIEDQKDEVEEQKEVVEKALTELGEKNKEIMDSISYAKRIQSAILPQAKVVKEYLKESFILYKPKDVVAGDFYWLEHKDNKVLFAAADCTGHGVPGAMVSVVCNNGLNRAVREHGLTDPGEILDKTRAIVVQEFEKSEEGVKDGMDIALCSLEGFKLQYAGAHNPLWIIRNGEIIEIKADKQPIGQFDSPKPYTTHHIDLEKGDSIYIFSDGYVDQFGGDKGKKLKAKAFKALLVSIQDKSMDEQKIIIDDIFEDWKGALEQIDDVCVIGVSV